MKLILSKSILKRRALSEYGSGTSWEDLELVDMTDSIKSERAAEKTDEKKIQEMEKDLLKFKNEIAWEEARCLIEIKAAPAKIAKEPGMLSSIKMSIEASKDRIKAFKVKFNQLHLQLYGKTFYSVSSARVVISKSLGRK